MLYRRGKVLDPDERVPFPLAWQAGVLVLVVITLSTTAMVLGISSKVSNALYRQYVSRGEALVSQVANVATRPMIAGDFQVVEEIARNAASSESVTEISITTLIEIHTTRKDRKKGITDVGTYVAHSDVKKLGKPYEYPPGLSPDSLGLPKVKLMSAEGKPLMRFAKPMIYTYKGSNQVVGRAEVIMDLAEISSSLASVRMQIAKYGLVAAVFGVTVMILVISAILRPIQRLKEAMIRVQQGDFIFQVKASDPSEVGLLTRTFNHMAAKLSELQEKMVQQELIKKELDIAETIQQGLLPEQLPELPGVEIAAYYDSAEEVGGDYYDYMEIGDGRWAFAIGDVSGKGIPGSLVMSMTRSILRSYVKAVASPAEALMRTNTVLCKDIPVGMFVTLVLAYLDTKTNRITLASAGHNPAIIRRNGKIGALRLRGLPLGADDSGLFDELINETSFKLEQNDIFVMYTDGVTEAMNKNGDMFGLEGLVESVKSYPTDKPIINFPVTLMRRIKQFRQGEPPNDDISFMVLKSVI